MKICSLLVVFISVLLGSWFAWAEPYTYGDFNGSYNISEPQSVYGDFDGDGRLDHVISQPESELLYIYMDSSDDKYLNLDRINSARVSMYSDIYPGSGTTYWDHELTPTDLDPTITSDTRIGSSLASGDFDGDGDDELVIGMPFASAGGRIYAGKVVIIDGGSNFPNRSKTVLYQSASGTFGTIWGRAEYADGFGDVLAGLTRVDYDPAWDHGVGGDIDSRWIEILQKNIHVIVGENDDGGSGDRCHRLNAAHTWVELVNSLYGGIPGTKDVTLCFADNATHDSDNTELREESALKLFLNLSAGHCVTPARTCLDWTP